MAECFTAFSHKEGQREEAREQQGVRGRVKICTSDFVSCFAIMTAIRETININGIIVCVESRAVVL